MTIDERGFESETKNYLTLTLEELRDAFKELALQFNKLILENRHLKIELSQLRMFASEEGITPAALKEIRKEVLSTYMHKMKPLKKKRGRPTSFQEKALVAELWRMYSLRENESLEIKPWLRMQVENEFKNNGYSLIELPPKNRLPRVT